MAFYRCGQSGGTTLSQLAVKADISGSWTVSYSSAEIGELYLIVATNAGDTTITSLTGATLLSSARQGGTAGNGVARINLVIATSTTISATFSTSTSGTIISIT